MTTEVTGMLVKVAGNGRGFAAAAADAEPLLEVPAGTAGGLRSLSSQSATWFKVPLADNPWDQAHAMIQAGFGAAGGGVLTAEPDLRQAWPADGDKAQACTVEPPNPEGGAPVHPAFAWHLGKGFSALSAANAAVDPAALAKITVAHLDTGYDPRHLTCPTRLHAAQHNFTKEGRPDSAIDITKERFGNHRGHGPATLALLAGEDPRVAGFRGRLGGAAGATAMPIRIADSVVRFTTSTMVSGFRHALENKADVLSMSMGGAASSALADAVNLAYEAGMVMVTAAGNFFPRVPSPRSIVYPARFRRVIAATGVMADGRPYNGLSGNTMQGCVGPDAKMASAIAAWTPNVPWAEIGCPTTVDLDGRGTSAATPQVAAAAALWLAHHAEALKSYSARWMRGEAARQALFRGARKSTAAMGPADVAKRLGAGALDAIKTLTIAPLAEVALTRTPQATASLSWLKLLTGEGVGLAPGAAFGPRARMLGLELIQRAQTDPELDSLLARLEDGGLEPAEWRRLLEGVRDSEPAGLGKPSAPLTRAIDSLERPSSPVAAGRPPAPRAGPAATPAAGPVAARRTSYRPEAPQLRRLRIFGLDPSLGKSLDSLESMIATIEVRNESDLAGDSILQPGPVGEYLEVVDVDPASDQFYPPVDLDDPRLQLQDGLTPSEGHPQFHQQMVYAVAMRTIENFERALGRVALWSDYYSSRSRDTGTSRFVPRLRIYPHALRQRNAFYSPERVALLFGYFPSQAKTTDVTSAGSLVFSCLSADIIAHEMTHALLDGFARGYREPSNPDVGAFHEAFSDIVALFQHFQYGDIVRRQIAASRGDLKAATLLGGLAKQFGEGSSQGGPLRDYLNFPPSISYAETFEVHDRGMLLVKAVYDAYLAIFERRTGDLVRLATRGTGIIEPGAIHPDLVDRLAAEACRAARHVLRMCIRALDYCPVSDITFGTYLRALITADRAVVTDDRYGYRTAFLQAFRARDLLPANLRTVSLETLSWEPHAPTGAHPPEWLTKAVEALDIDWLANIRDRKEIFDLHAERCKKFHSILKSAILDDPSLATRLGLVPGLGKYRRDGTKRHSTGTNFEVRSVRPARRARPDGSLRHEIIVVIAQRRPEPFDGTDPANGTFWFRGGATLIIDPRNAYDQPELLYVITKSLANGERLERERQFRTDPPILGLRSMYFGSDALAAREPFAALHMEEVR